MKITRVVRNDDGQVEATLMLTNEQAAFLINAGLAMLVQRGAVELADMSREEFEATRGQATGSAGEMIEADAASESTPADPQPAETGETVVDVGSNDKEQKAFLEAVDSSIMFKA